MKTNLCKFKIYLKIKILSAYSIGFCKNKAPGLPLPPKLMITCWKTWLNATIYYYENIKQINVLLINSTQIMQFISIQMAQDILADKSLNANFTCIKSNAIQEYRLSKMIIIIKIIN